MTHSIPRTRLWLVVMVLVGVALFPADLAMAQPLGTHPSGFTNRNDCATCYAGSTLYQPPAAAPVLPVFRKCDVFQTPRFNDYPCGQCTWYAAYLRPDIPTSNTLWPRPANASTWDDNWRKLGYATTHVPEPGAIAVFEPAFVKNRDGHVAYVVAVEPMPAKTYSMTVTHMNWDQCYGSTQPCQSVFQVSPEDEVSFIPPAVVLFESPYFGGTEDSPALLRLQASEGDLSQHLFFGSNRRTDLHVNSIYIPQGWVVELFSEPAFEGAQLVQTGTISLDSSFLNLTAVAYPDGSPVTGNVRSIRITHPSNGM